MKILCTLRKQHIIHTHKTFRTDKVDLKFCTAKRCRLAVRIELSPYNRDTFYGCPSDLTSLLQNSDTIVI